MSPSMGVTLGFSAGVMVGLDDLGGLFQPNHIILCGRTTCTAELRLERDGKLHQNAYYTFNTTAIVQAKSQAALREVNESCFTEIKQSVIRSSQNYV